MNEDVETLANHVRWTVEVLRTYGIEEHRCEQIAEALLDDVTAPLLDQARRDAAEKARQEAEAVKDREFGNLRWMDGHAQGLKDGRAEALAPVLAHLPETPPAVASHQEGGA